MPGPTTFQVDCSGAPATGEVIGEGPPVLIIGGAIPMAWTRPLSSDLASCGFTAINFDYETPEGWEPESQPRTAIQQATDAATVLSASGYEQAHVVGISRAAITAFAVASRHEQMATTLTLVCPVAAFGDILPPAPPPEASAADTDPLMTMLRLGFSDRYLADHLEHAKDLVMMPEGTVSRVDRMDEEPFGPQDTTGVPTLVLEFGDDQMVRSANSRRYLEALPHADHVVIDEAGHGWFHERPHEVGEAIASFISKG